jgi:GTPase SAR1 family protein
LEHLGTLDVRDNPEITELPSKLHHLKNLIGFQYRGIGDPIIATLDTFKDTAQVLYYLRARETDAVVNKTMRLFVIGHSQKGKSTVLRTLKGEKPSKESISRARLGSVGDKKPVEKESVGIQCDMWRCVRKKSTQTIIFYTWDFVGHDEYYVTHQCFLTNRALYLLVWKLTDKEQGIEGLSVWLRNLQAGAPYAQVIIIGTHLDLFRRNERHSDVLLDKYRKKIMQDCSFHNRMSPMIKGIVFVGFSEPLFGGNITPINFDELNDKIFDTANSMEIPRSSDAPSFKMKLMDEKIPKCYLELQELVQTLIMKIPNRIIYKKTDFCALKDVKDIIDNEQEIDAAIDFLHNMGRVFHFHKPYLEDFYILSPQWWFNACALIISPNVVNSIVSAGSEPGSGLLNFKAMEQMFIKKNLTGEYAGLIFSFLHQYGVILPVDKETALVPSMISPIPSVKLFTSVGYFPRDVKNDKGDSHQQTSGFSGFFEYLPAALKSLPSKVKVVVTGLVYRRMFLLPPLPAGFWSKLIALCLQKNDFVKIIANIAEDKISSSMGGHGLYYHLESCVVRWSYWKTGLVLFINDTMLMSINSLKMDEFIDPLDRAVISASYDKVKNFHFADSNGDIIPVTPFKEIIEVVVPEVDLLTSHKYDRNISAKLLAKGLEMIDEVLKGHCETLSENGIYTIGDMLHIVPCPLCFGDVDYRSASWNHAPMNQHPSLAHRIKIMSDKKPLTIDQVHKLKASNVAIVFSIDQCIRASMTRSYIECPICKDLELEYLVPDIIFKDLSNMKLDRDLLMDMPKSDGSPIGSGCYGVVYHKQMRPLVLFVVCCLIVVVVFVVFSLNMRAQLK